MSAKSIENLLNEIIPVQCVSVSEINLAVHVPVFLVLFVLQVSYPDTDCLSLLLVGGHLRTVCVTGAKIILSVIFVMSAIYSHMFV